MQKGRIGQENRQAIKIRKSLTLGVQTLTTENSTG